MRAVPSSLAAVNILDHFNHVHDTCETPRQHKSLYENVTIVCYKFAKYVKRIQEKRLMPTFRFLLKIHAERRTHFPEKVENKIE